MSVQWYYSHGGITHGPFSDEEIKDHAARKMLLETDRIWPEGRDPKDAAPAAAVVEFPKSHAVTTPIPDWLADIAAAEKSGPAPAPSASDKVPDWLDDLRLWLGLELYTPAKHPTSEHSPPSGNIPDWLEGWLTSERPNAQQIPPAVPMPSPQQVNANPLVERILDASGFDLETGQIFDPAKFQKWKQEQAQSTPVTNASLLEVFRNARFAIEAWVDDEANRIFIMQTAIEDIKLRPDIQAILRDYANYGQAMQEKLWRHLEFMIENRKKFSAAVEKLRSI